MANTFNLDINNVAKLAAVLVGRDFNLAALISRDVEAEFMPGKGNKVRVPVPAAIPTRTRGVYDKTTALVADELSEQFIEVTLADHVYNLAVLSEGDLSLSMTDYGRQVLAPQTRAIAAKIEALTASAMSATPAEASIMYSAATPAKAFTAARRELRDNGVPGDAILRAAVGSSVYADLLDAPVGQGFDADGKVRGFEVVESTRLDPEDIVAFVPQAFTLVARAPMVPQGAAYGASIVTPVFSDDNSAQFAVRVVNDYDSNVAADRSLVGTFAAVQAMPLPVDNEDGSVTLLDHGGAVRISTGV
ncbi:hypothetical protein [Microbacterium sufflavum]|uniref:Uncharacterized protein n=1 Tax=Microbacterium sufflavum TaxID=2851649 RepID=A0ABY4IJ15_9MICO|nr:hypothetical protein [Microbacterium sufflavum]UPL12592.1 hypothetical protein KV394_16425 [Microbacterium sufflavum]